nr:MAG TPA: hypothetical protein [Caudoviricetes sp.]
MSMSTVGIRIYSHMGLPRLWGVDQGFGSFCKGSWEKIVFSRQNHTIPDQDGTLLSFISCSTSIVQ